LIFPLSAENLRISHREQTKEQNFKGEKAKGKVTLQNSKFDSLPNFSRMAL
jgi:hypothetical protein